jgi:hypothetical protein
VPEPTSSFSGTTIADSDATTISVSNGITTKTQEFANTTVTPDNDPAVAENEAAIATKQELFVVESGLGKVERAVVLGTGQHEMRAGGVRLASPVKLGNKIAVVALYYGRAIALGRILDVGGVKYAAVVTKKHAFAVGVERNLVLIGMHVGTAELIEVGVANRPAGNLRPVIAGFGTSE